MFALRVFSPLQLRPGPNMQRQRIGLDWSLRERRGGSLDLWRSLGPRLSCVCLFISAHGPTAVAAVPQRVQQVTLYLQGCRFDAQSTC